MKYILIFILLIPVLVLGQQDSVKVRKIKYDPEFKFTDGIFLNIEDVKNNDPIIKARIITDLDYNDFSFFEKLLSKDVFIVLDGVGLRKEIKSNSIWGFSQNGVVYIYWNEEFSRIPVFGSIGHFIADKTYIQQNNTNYPYGNNNYYNPYDPYYPNRSQTTKTELRQYLLDMETGKIVDYNYKNLEIILMRDPELYKEFIELKKKDRKKLKFLFLRKYNDKHPLYITEKY